MRRFISILLKLVVFLIVIIAVSQFWWHMWMNNGWIGTPRILHGLTNADGEASYNRTLDEMMIITGVVIFIGYFLVRRILRFLNR